MTRSPDGNVPRVTDEDAPSRIDARIAGTDYESVRFAESVVNPWR